MDRKPETLYQMGENLYQMGEYAASALCYKEAAELFHPGAQYGYARCLEWGLGVEADIGAAFMWYEYAAQLGNVQAMCRMGDMERDGERGVSNLEAAFAWYLRAAEAGYPPAMEYVASCYFYGRGVAADIKEAAHWYQKAAESSCELTPQQVVSLERVLSAAAREAALQAEDEHQRPADKR